MTTFPVEKRMPRATVFSIVAGLTQLIARLEIKAQIKHQSTKIRDAKTWEGQGIFKVRAL